MAPILGFGPFELHPHCRQLRRGGQPLTLRASAFEVLLALAERPGEVLPKRLLCERAWPGREVDENNLQVDVSALRKLIGARAIVTASGRGYQFAMAVTRRDAGDAAPSAVGEADIAALQALLAGGGLVSIVGEGGTGKTRLALALGSRHALARVARFDEVDSIEGAIEAAASALDIAAATQRDLIESLAAWPGLLVLDTCDAAAQPLAELLAALMAGCPGLMLLATSREVLRVPGEQLYRLAPLDLDETISRFDAAATLPRHRSLAASFDWSWRGLTAVEKRLLEALPGLAQPFSLDALLALAPDGSGGRWERVDVLARLVDKSLVAAQAHTEPAAYRLSAATLAGLRRRGDQG